jgi:hypothetical protein
MSVVKRVGRHHRTDVKHNKIWQGTISRSHFCWNYNALAHCMEIDVGEKYLMQWTGFVSLPS